MFESLVINWLLEASASAVARNLNLSWDEVDGRRRRAVERGIARREVSELNNLRIDDTSYKRGHRYLTIITDQDTGEFFLTSKKIARTKVYRPFYRA